MGKNIDSRNPRFSIGLVLALAACMGASGCAEDDPDTSRASNDDKTGGSATETNAQPAPCDDDGDCPDGKACAKGAGETSGFCEVDEMVVDGGDAGTDAGDAVSSSAPAPCMSSDECPDGIECVQEDGPDTLGFCDVSEMVINPSSAAPAPCMSDDECPADIDCVQADGPDTLGFCDVNEMSAP